MRRFPVNLVIFVVGLLLASVGTGMIYLPAGLVCAGTVLMAISIFGDRQGDKQK